MEVERIQYLANQVSDMYRGKTDLSRLGEIALQVIIARSELEEIIEGNYLEKQKRAARKKLEYIKEIEKNLIYLYIRSMTRPRQWMRKPAFGYPER